MLFCKVPPIPTKKTSPGGRGNDMRYAVRSCDVAYHYKRMRLQRYIVQSTDHTD